MAPTRSAPGRDDARDVLSEMLCVESDRVHPEARLVDDLAMDSIDLAEVVVMLEDVFDVRLTDETAKGWVTVGDIYESLGVES